MGDHTVKRFSEMETYFGGVFRKARGEIGAKAFGLSVIELAAGADNYPEHDHIASRQEEVFIVLSGTGEIDIDDFTVALEPEMMVRIGPVAKRRIRPGSDGIRLVAIGGVVGEGYVPPPYTEVGVVDPSNPPTLRVPSSQP